MREPGKSSPAWEATSSRAFESMPRRSSSPSVGDLINQFSQLNSQVNSLVLDRMNQMVLDALQPVLAMQPKAKTEMRCSECGDPCREDNCHCRCCIHDADLVVYARLGEVRMVPIRLENSRRREREINLDFSGWSSRSGKQTGIESQILPAGEFTLPACSEKELMLRVDASRQTSDQPGETSRLPEVDDCTVLYGDLRVEGCDIRPIRIALALMPPDCDPYVIHCDCNCC